jgi:hypothetical protein
VAGKNVIFGSKKPKSDRLLGAFFGTPSATATLISLGGFGAQVVVALCGVLFLPFVKFLGLETETTRQK